MSWLLGPYLVAAALLVLAGAPKIREPAPAVRALASVGLPAYPWLVRVLGAVEMAIGAAALVVGGRIPAILVAASYAAFSGFVAGALLRGGVLSSCGCFGRADTPPTRTHLGVTLALAGVGLALAVRPLGALPPVLLDTPRTGLLLVAFAAIGLWFAYLALAVMPRSGGRAGVLAAAGTS